MRKIMKRNSYFTAALLCCCLCMAAAARAEKIGVVFLTAGEEEYYKHDWVYQYFNVFYDLMPPGFYAGGNLEGGTCYTMVHYASEAESVVCGVPAGTPIDVFCNEYKGGYPVHSYRDHLFLPFGDGGWRKNCYPSIVPMFPLLGDKTVDPATGETITGPHVDDPAASGIGIADFAEVINFDNIYDYYRRPGNKLRHREQMLRWWYGNDAPGYAPLAAEPINIKDALTARFPEHEFVFRHGWETYMENIDPYGDFSAIADSTETAIKDLVAAGVQRIVVAHTYACFATLTQYGHEWYDSQGKGISAVPEKTFKECVEDPADGVGPATRKDVRTYLKDKPWDSHDQHPWPMVRKLVSRQNPNLDVRFAPPYGQNDEFDRAVLGAIRHAVTKYSIPATASLKIVLLSHGNAGSYMNAQNCDVYYSLVDPITERLIARVTDNFTWSGKFEVAGGASEMHEGSSDPPSAEKPFGEKWSVGEQIDKAINGKYVNALGQVVDNGNSNFDYILVIPWFYESESSDTLYRFQEGSIGNNIYTSGDYYRRSKMDADGTEYGPEDVDSEIFTVKVYDGTGWPSYPGCLEDKKCEENNEPVNKGSGATQPTTLIMSGTVLALDNSTNSRQAVQGLTDAAVKSIEQALSETPLRIVISEFTAVPQCRAATLVWRTWTETDVAGFNLYRAASEQGEYTKVNKELIRAEGHPASPASYEFTDTGLKNGKTYYYRFEDIDSKGTATTHDTVAVRPGIFKKAVKQ